jgi:hypothetical protein
MIAQVLFYGILAWIGWYILQLFRRRAFSARLFLASLPLNAFLGACLWAFYLIFTFTLGFQGVGRGYRDSVYVETSNDIDSAMAFRPAVSIPLGEVIDFYGEPDTVWFTSDTPCQAGRPACCFTGMHSMSSWRCRRLQTTPIRWAERPVSKGSFFTMTRMSLL